MYRGINLSGLSWPVRLLALFWAIGVIWGLFLLLEYECRPGEQAKAPPVWPSGSTLRLHPEKPTLLMLAHPHCPCTRASIGELEKLLARYGSRVDAHILFLQPPGRTEDWTKSDLWRSASAVPGLSLWPDEDGRERERFKVATSGQVLLYLPSGELAFLGGITPSRGHYGDSRGQAAIEKLLLTAADLDTSTSAETSGVFGCQMTNKEKQECPNPR